MALIISYTVFTINIYKDIFYRNLKKMGFINEAEWHANNSPSSKYNPIDFVSYLITDVIMIIN